MFNRRYCRTVRVGEITPVVMKKIMRLCKQKKREREKEIESQISQEETEPGF